MFEDLIKVDDLRSEDSVDIEAGFNVSTSIYDGIMEGLLQALAYERGEATDVRVVARTICDEHSIAWDEDATEATLNGAPVTHDDIGRVFNAKVQFDKECSDGN